MKKKTTIQRLTFVFLSALLLGSCTQIRTVTSDLLSSQTAREKYQEESGLSEELLQLWEQQSQMALTDSVQVNLPYAEAGKFFPGSSAAHAYEIALNPGENLHVQIDTDSINTLVFMDLYKLSGDSIRTFEKLSSGEYRAKNLMHEITEPGIYKILLQPEINADTPFRIDLFSAPSYVFPVAGKGNKAIQSFWGAVRDGGRRSHEGVDIFAPRGTPVVAATPGRVTSTGNKGLGGKQVWLRDSKRGNSLYYAHLDSIAARPGMRVSPGDTLGFVGNTGNARTTPPHLHFGIYKGYRGAINPLPFIYETEEPADIVFPGERFAGNLGVTTSGANIRRGPSTKMQILNTLAPRDTLNLLGKTQHWFHIRTEAGNSFIHESLVAPLN